MVPDVVPRDDAGLVVQHLEPHEHVLRVITSQHPADDGPGFIGEAGGNRRNLGRREPLPEIGEWAVLDIDIKNSESLHCRSLSWDRVAATSYLPVRPCRNAWTRHQFRGSARCPPLCCTCD